MELRKNEEMGKKESGREECGGERLSEKEMKNGRNITAAARYRTILYNNLRDIQ